MARRVIITHIGVLVVAVTNMIIVIVVVLIDSYFITAPSFCFPNHGRLSPKRYFPARAQGFPQDPSKANPEMATPEP